ncbi:NUDIX domain-containing protein [Candidatus Leptofilum sp.]|uniref:NUDIX domain-containing protein n=1 Tax=Candidatus Leptofilum sp. TaxID=3241576 RepID=UPI003B5C2FB6
MTKPFKTTSSQIVWSCPWYRVRQDGIITPNGRPGQYNVIESPTSVWIVPVTPAGEIALIYTYRYTVDAWGWEVPAGSIKPNQTELEAAVCELKEEVGGKTADDLVEIGRFNTANGICNELGVYYLATNVILGKPVHEAAEVIEVHTKPIGEVLHMAHSGQISDGNTVLALLLCADKLRSLV